MSSPRRHRLLSLTLIAGGVFTTALPAMALRPPADVDGQRIQRADQESDDYDIHRHRSTSM